MSSRKATLEATHARPDPEGGFGQRGNGLLVAQRADVTLPYRAGSPLFGFLLAP